MTTFEKKIAAGKISLVDFCIIGLKKGIEKSYLAHTTVRML
jgi:hypothetical protein